MLTKKKNDNLLTKRKSAVSFFVKAADKWSSLSRRRDEKWWRWRLRSFRQGEERKVVVVASDSSLRMRGEVVMVARGEVVVDHEVVEEKWWWRLVPLRRSGGWEDVGWRLGIYMVWILGLEGLGLAWAFFPLRPGSVGLEFKLNSTDLNHQGSSFSTRTTREPNQTTEPPVNCPKKLNPANNMWSNGIRGRWRRDPRNFFGEGVGRGGSNVLFFIWQL